MEVDVYKFFTGEITHQYIEYVCVHVRVRVCSIARRQIDSLGFLYLLNVQTQPLRPASEMLVSRTPR